MLPLPCIVHLTQLVSGAIVFVHLRLHTVSHAPAPHHFIPFLKLLSTSAKLYTSTPFGMHLLLTSKM